MNILLLDRDGTIIENVPYLNNPDKIKVIEECIVPLRMLQNAGWRLSIVSNQSGIGRKMISMQEVHLVNKRVRELFIEQGIYLDFIYFCPHAPWQSCRCRKPNSRLIETLITRYLQEFGGSVDRVVMIGDSQCDNDAAMNANIEFFQVGHLGNSNDSHLILDWYTIRDSLL